MQIKTKRVCEEPSADDGLRVLVDRIWPRGIAKDDLEHDHWLKDLAPSDELRQWFDHDAEKWPEFKKRYFAELRERKDELHDLLSEVGPDGTLTLLFAARDEAHCNAAALREYLNRIEAHR